MPPRVKEKEGAFVRIKLLDSLYGYARIIVDKYYAFYDFFSKDTSPSVEDVLGSETIFTLSVHRSALRAADWEIIGHMPLEDKFKEYPVFFIQSPFDNSLKRYQHGVSEKATLEECLGLERMVVWDREGIEDRLKAHYLGVPDKWAEFYAIKK